jgi:hypothetical protein
VEAWLAKNEFTLFLIANDYWCEKPAFFLCEVADAALEWFIMIRD